MATIMISDVIAITGANGFIGRHLVQALTKLPYVSIRVLVRSLSGANHYGKNVTHFEGDLTKLDSLKGFLTEGCTVVNLAYSFSSSNDQNISATNNLIKLCGESNIKRLIHCSTAAVYGRINSSCVDELSECNPGTDYGKTKLLIEQILSASSKGRFEYVNVRPTAVYGPEGQALKKLVNDLENDNYLFNYLRSCFFNVRSLNLVHVSNVVSAIIFLMDLNKEVDRQMYIVSEDFESNNNYKYVENFLLRRLLNRQHPIPPIHIPLFFLSLLLRFLGRDSVNPSMLYDTKKLKNIGFNYEMSLDAGLNELCDWYELQRKSNILGDN